MSSLVIIPACNEELNLPAVLQAVRAHCPGYDVAVIDDASTDSTASIARQAGAAVLPLLGLPVPSDMDGRSLATGDARVVTVRTERAGETESGPVTWATWRRLFPRPSPRSRLGR